MVKYNWVNIGSGNGLLPDKAIARAIINFSLAKFHGTHLRANFTAIIQATILYNEFEKYVFKITATSRRGQWVNFFSKTS